MVGTVRHTPRLGPVSPPALPPALAGPFAAVLLDLDGTLVDSIGSVERSWRQWCGEFGVDPHRLVGFHGVTAENLIAELLPAGQRERAFARIREIEVADVEGIALLPGADRLLAALTAGGVPTAVVTSGTEDLARARIRASGLAHPGVLVTASDVERGKPFPDPWLLGARHLGVAPADCLVVEDAVAGLRAARAAGCGGLLAVATTMARDELAAEADLVLPALDALEVEASSGLVRVTGWA